MAKLRLFVVPHTHYDAEVFLTRDVTLKLGADNILDALFLLDRHADYRYVLDQRCYVEGFVELFPEQVERLKAHIASGRLEIAGDMHVMPDANMPSGESFVRQILYGRAFMQRVLGTRSKIGWMLDSFGHHPQIPQLMRKAGFTAYAMQRGPSQRDPAAFVWVGLDGSRIRCEWMPQTYAILGRVPPTLPAFAEVMEHIRSLLAPYAYNDRFLALSGLDLSAPDQALPELMRRYNEAQDQVELVFATPSEYFAAQPADGLPDREGDLNPIFTGCYAARIALKQHNRALETQLFDAEKLMAVNWALGTSEVESLENAWEGVLFNQFHDIICGSHLDEIYRHAIDRYTHAAQLVQGAQARTLATLGARIDTRGEGIPLLVVNTLAHQRVDVVRCTVGLSNQGWETLALYDQAGTQLPLQLDQVLRQPDGTIKRADVLFIAEVPALGYRTYFVRGASDTQQPATDVWHKPAGNDRLGLIVGNLEPDDGQIGNRYFDVRANLRSGAISALVLRDADWNVVAPGHEHGFGSVCRQEDRGDPWEYYGPLRGNVTTTIPLVDGVPPRGQAVFSDQYGGQGWASAGPVMAELRVKSPFGDGEYETRIRVYAGLQRVELDTELVNRQKFVRYRNVFPLNLEQPSIVYEIPFGALERPEGEYPAQNWVDVGDGTRGVALLNRGIPGHSLVGNVLTSSLMKCSKVVTYQGGGYSGEASDSAGFELGVRHRYEQALVPHDGSWSAAQLTRAGQEFNTPLLVVKTTAHDGVLPGSGSLVSIDSPSIVLHAMFVEGNQLVVRLAEAAGRPAEGRITFGWPIGKAEETDLDGGAAREPAVDGGSVGVSLTPFEVTTLRVTRP